MNDKEFVKIHYTGYLKDGTVFDSSKDRDPLEFVMGLGMIIPGLEKSIAETEKGDSTKVTIQADDAYGQKNPEAMQEVAKSQLPEGIDVKEGTQLSAQTEQGPIPVMVTEVKDESVIVDFNHPLAGQDLVFEYDLIEKRPASQEDIDKFTK